jgi:tetraacyldisaccharide 4'-kinase
MRRPWLAPLNPLYAAGVALRNARIAHVRSMRRLNWPVVSIGNLSTGGAGKTPLTIVLALLLKGAGFEVDILSRGYGREGSTPAKVPQEGTAAEFGDEPLLIAREAGVPVYVAGQRYQAGLLAEADRAGALRLGVHLLDDGFQHRQLHRDVDILLINRADWHDSLLPAGNLREPLQAIKRASLLAIPTDEPELDAELRKWGWKGPVWRLQRRIEVPKIDGPVIAFCGIARPEQFFAGLESGGLRVASKIVFPDHHRYSARDVDRLLAAASSAGAAALITTEKDHVRLGSLNVALSRMFPLKTARLEIDIEDAEGAIQWLMERLHPFTDR